MMKALEILVMWLAFDIGIGIPIWMLLKHRDRREEGRAENSGSENSAVVVDANSDVVSVASYGMESTTLRTLGGVEDNR